MNTATSSNRLNPAPLMPARPWLNRAAHSLYAVARRGAAAWAVGWQSVRRSLSASLRKEGSQPQGPDLGSLMELSDAVLKDIDVPEGLRAQAAQCRERAELLLRLDLYRGSADPTRW
jgi:HEPN domain-containing protein